MNTIRMNKRRYAIALIALVLTSAGVAAIMKPSEKEQKLSHFEHHAPVQGKAGGGVVIEISAPHKDGALGSIIDLEAKIQTKKDFKALEYTWILPDGISAAGGNTKGLIGVVKRGETVTLTLKVVKSTEENRQIHLQVFQMNGRKKSGYVAQFNTVGQEVLNLELRTKAEMLRERMPANEDGERRFKIMQ